MLFVNDGVCGREKTKEMRGFVDNIDENQPLSVFFLVILKELKKF